MSLGLPAGGASRRLWVVAAVVGLLTVAAVVYFVVFRGQDSAPSGGAPPSEVTTTDGTDATGVAPTPSENETAGHPPSSPTKPTETTEPTDGLLDQQRALLRTGVIGFRGPEPMRVDERQRVTVRVADDAVAASVSDLPGSGSVTVEPTVVGSYLRAALTSQDFEISRVGDDDGRRVLLTDGYAEWAWDVRPLRSGRLQLDVTLYVLVAGDSSPLEVRTYERAIRVEVNTWYSVQNWLKEWGPVTGLTVPVVAGAAWALVRHLRKKRATPPRRPARRRRASTRRS